MNNLCIFFKQAWHIYKCSIVHVLLSIDNAKATSVIFNFEQKLFLSKNKINVFDDDNYPEQKCSYLKQVILQSYHFS